MDYDKALYKNYDKGRQYSPETLTLWLETLGRYIPRRTDLRILDLGSGTGRFTVPLAHHFEATVVGVEPSEKMRQ